MQKIFFTTLANILIVPSIASAAITTPSGTGLPDSSTTGGISGILTGFTKWLLGIFLILAILSFVITGIMYLLSMGDSRSQTLENAKKGFQYSIVAVTIVGSSYIIILFIDNLLNAAL